MTKKTLVVAFLPFFLLSAFNPDYAQGQSAANQVASRVVEDGGTGPYSAIMLTESTLPTHTVFRPKDLSVFTKGSKLPIMAWGNGACANSPWEHINFLSEVASYGFLVVAIGSMPLEGEKGSGKSTSSQLLDAIDWAVAQNADQKSPYYQKLDVTKVAVSGMSCGGLQTLEVANDPRVSTVVVCNSGIFSTPLNGRSGMPNLTKENLSKLHTPTLYMLGGEKDIAKALVYIAKVAVCCKNERLSPYCSCSDEKRHCFLWHTQHFLHRRPFTLLTPSLINPGKACFVQKRIR